MSQDAPNPGPDEEPPIAKLLPLLGGKWAAFAVHATAELGVADALFDGPRTPEQVAKATGIRVDGATRLLRALSVLGVTEAEGDRYALTPVGAHLADDGPASLAGLAKIQGRPWHDRAWEGFVEQLRTGECAMQTVHGETFNRFIADRPADERAFGEAMANFTEMNAPPIVASYDFSDLRTIVDIGGGYGSLLAEILEEAPDSEGVLFDLPTVAETAEQRLAGTDVGDRIDVEGGDYLDAVPEGGDAYVLSSILHNHEDAEAIELLSNVREAMASDGRVVIVDFLLDGPEGPGFAAMLDLELYVLLGGRQRATDEFAELLSKAGFGEPTVHETPTPMSVVEAAPA